MSERSVIMTRCPLGGTTEILFETGAIDRAFDSVGANLVMLQSLPEEEHVKHLTQAKPLAFRDGGNVPPIWSHSKGTPTKVIGMHGLIQSHAIIVAKDSDIKTPEDLRGKRLSVPDFGSKVIDPMRAMVKRGYDTILKAYNIDSSEVIFVDTKCNKKANGCPVDNHGNLIGNKEGVSSDHFVQHHVEEIELLLEGKIDAFFSHRTLIKQIVDKGLGRVLIDISDTDLPKVNNIYPTVITVDEDFARENRDVVVAYLLEQLKAADLVEKNPQDYEKATLAGQYGATLEQQRQTREKEWYKKLRPSFDKELVDSLRSQKDFLLDKGIIENDFDLDEWLDDSFLREAEELYKKQS